MNEIKINNPTKLNVTKLNNEQYDIEGIERYYGVEEDDEHICFPFYTEDNIDNYLKSKGIPFKIEEQFIIINKKYLNIKNNLHEIKRLQQLAGINEIKIQNPIVSSEQIIELYNKIDDYIGSHWNEDFGPNEVNSPEIIALDKELDQIMEEYDSRFTTGYNEIKAYLSKDPTKNKILYNKLKELDSKINYNINEIKINNPLDVHMDYKDVLLLIKVADSHDENKTDALINSYAMPSFYFTNNELRQIWWRELDTEDKRNLIKDLKQIINNP